MRHLSSNRKLGRPTTHRIAMLKNLVTALLRHGHINTTEARARELRSIAERVITFSKRASLLGEENAGARVHEIRKARRWIVDRDVLKTIFTEYGIRYADRPGGYTRVIKLGFRAGDNTAMARIELV